MSYGPCPPITERILQEMQKLRDEHYERSDYAFKQYMSCPAQHADQLNTMIEEAAAARAVTSCITVMIGAIMS